MGWLLAGIVFFVLIVVAEKALIAVTPHELDILRAEGTPSARRVVGLADENSHRSLAAVAIGRLFLLVAIVLNGANTLFFQAFFQKTTDYLSAQYGLGFLAKPIMAFILSAIFAFLLWKISQINLRRAQRPIAGFWLQRLSPIILFCHFLFRPFLPKKAVVPVAPQHPTTETPSPVQQDTGKRDIEILKSIAKFGDVTIRQVMQPQPKIVALEVQTPFEEVLSLIRTSDFSRIPVYEDDMDNVIGTLYVKDIMDGIGAPPGFDWKARIRPDVFIVPETKPISELLLEFKIRRLHLAIVVDEYGGTAGLVTMEDILEEVTGEIRDEFDEENEIPPYKQLDDKNFLFAGTTTINDVCHITGIDLDTFEAVRDDADTIAGLALELIGDIPAVGDQVTWGQYLITIEKANNRRIEEVRFSFTA